MVPFRRFIDRALQLGMTAVRPVVLVLVLFTVAAAKADPVVLEIVRASPAVRCRVTAVAVKTPAAGMREIPLAEPVMVAETFTSVPVTISDWPAEVVPIGKGCWAASLHITAPAADPFRVEVWPAATVIGGLAFERKSETPRAIAGALLDPAGRSPEPLACELSDRIWRCTVPAGRTLNLQVAVDDFAPLFVWDVNLVPDAVYDSGIQTVVRGAAVAGRAMLDRGRPAANARIRILPLAAGHQPASDRAMKARETRSNAGGHFQLAGLEPGVYRIVSTVEGRGNAVIESLELRAGEHVQLREPLFHEELAELIVLLTPPVSSSQAPWSVELLRAGDRDMELVSVIKGAASVDGYWSKAGLQPMQYQLRVIGPQGSHLVARDVVLHGGREQITIDVSALRVTGKVLAGDAGVVAELTFDNNGRSVNTTSDEEGAFTAEFPVAGLWRPRVSVGRTRLRLEPVEIADPPTDELILRLPGGGVAGKVFDTNGKPVVDVVVALKGVGMMPSTTSDGDGKFRLIGVEAGQYTIEAAAGEDLAAGPLPVTIAKDEVTEIDLRMEPWREVTGVVTTANGAPASGAVVRNYDPLTGLLEDVFADARGAFSFKVKPRSSTIDLIVLAPPAPIAMRQISMGNRRVVSANVQLAPVGTKLRIYIPRTPPWPVLTGPDGVSRSLGLLLMPLFERRMWRELVDGGFNFLLEPGPYRLCEYGGTPCRELQLAAHAETKVILSMPTASSTP